MFSIEQDIPDDDLSLWSRFLKGDDDAYGYVYKRYAKKLFVQGLQFTADRELIKDCIHDVFVKIYNNRNTLHPVQNLKIYLFISLKNNIVTSLNKQKIQFEKLDENSEQGRISDDNTVEENMINEETELNERKLINKLLLSLTGRQREVIHYRYFEGLSLNEISILMDMSYQSVQNLLQRSLKKIDELLKKNYKK